MGFLYRLKQTLYRLMYGRNGLDTLGWGLLALYCVLSFVLNFFEGKTALVLYFLAMCVFAYFVFRFFSRNVQKRRAESDKFSAFIAKTKALFQPKRYQTAKDKSKVIRVCPACKAKIRLPKTKGRHSVTCPRCHETFNVRI